jgi:hypothetical protein
MAAIGIGVPPLILFFVWVFVVEPTGNKTERQSHSDHLQGDPYGMKRATHAQFFLSSKRTLCGSPGLFIIIFFFTD